MSGEIKERQKALQDAIRALQTKREELSTLKERKRQFETGELGTGTAQKAKTIRRETLIDFILGRVVKDDVDSADEAVFKAERNDKLTVEMIETIGDTIKKLEAQIPSLQNAISMARGELWKSIYDTIKQQAQTKVGGLPVLAMAAGAHCGKSPQAVLLDCFGSDEGPNKSIHLEFINAAAAELKKEYGLEN